MDPSFNECIAMFTDLGRLFKNYPNETVLSLSCFASHGMIQDGRQVILLNQFDKSKGFYKILGVEEDMRKKAAQFSNAYLITIFACCREIFLVAQHSGGISREQVKVIQLAQKVKDQQEAMAKLAKKLCKQVGIILKQTKQVLDNMSRKQAAIESSRRDRQKRKYQELKEELEKATERGHSLLDKANQMNSMFIYGCRPSTGIKANTTMVKDIYEAFIENADRINFTVLLPMSLDYIEGKDVIFEIVTSA